MLFLLLEFYLVLAHYLFVTLNKSRTLQQPSNLRLLCHLRSGWLYRIHEPIRLLIERISQLWIHRCQPVQLFFEVKDVVLEITDLFILFNKFLIRLPLPPISQLAS